MNPIELADEVNRAHKSAARAIRASVRDATECGILICAAKAVMSHEEWMAWIKGYCSFSVRTARRYMRLASGLAKAERFEDAGEKAADDLNAKLRNKEFARMLSELLLGAGPFDVGAALAAFAARATAPSYSPESTLPWLAPDDPHSAATSNLELENPSLEAFNLIEGDLRFRIGEMEMRRLLRTAGPESAAMAFAILLAEVNTPFDDWN
jgi:Protein of unknown function (DUF3102)